MPAFCLLLYSSYYSNNFAGIIDWSLPVMNILSFDVKFQSDSVNNGQVIEGGIYIMFLPVKYSRVVVASFILRCALSLLLKQCL